MTAKTQETNQTQQAEPIQWKEKLARDWYRVKLADQALQVDKDMRRQAIIERLIKKTQEGTLQTPTAEPMDNQFDEPMAVRIGDESHIHYHNEKSVTEAAPKDKPSSIGKTLAGIGLAAAGLGTGAALPIAAYQLLRPDTNVIVPPSVDTDTDTRYKLRVFRDEAE